MNAFAGMLNNVEVTTHAAALAFGKPSPAPALCTRRRIKEVGKIALESVSTV